MTCDDADDNTTDVCRGTCTCSVESDGLIWRLPGSVSIVFDDKAGVGSNGTTDGIFFAVITNKTGGVLESMLTYATESLVNGTIECSGNAGAGAMSTTINVTLAG